MKADPWFQFLLGRRRTRSPDGAAMTKSMRAARLHQIGRPFQIDEIPVPEPSAADVLVRVRACGIVPNLRNVITHYPVWFPHLPLPKLPAIYGLDATGEIAAVGPDVIGLEVGQRVYVNPLRSCGTCLKCRTGKKNDCTALILGGYFGASPNGQAMFNRYPWGGLAEFMIAPGSEMVSLPDNLSFESASRFGYLGTAYAAMRRANAGPDTSVAIYGATGTVGVGGVLCCLALGVPKILAVARNEKILNQLAQLAPRRIFPYSTNKGPAANWVRSMTGGAGADVVLEALSPEAPVEAMTDLFACTARLGTIVSVGGAKEMVPFDPQWLMQNGIRYFGSGWFTTAEAHGMADLAGAGLLDLAAIENRCFPLAQVNEALDFACDRTTGGLCNVVVTP
jgi:threonine dehydrogenase-like Zn-dependent dehydrogenase